MTIIYTYRDYSATPSNVFGTGAGNLLEADQDARAAGFNPLKLVCCIGVVVEFIDPALIGSRSLWTDPKTGVVELIHDTGVVLRSGVIDTIEAYSAFVNDNEDRLPATFKIFLEFPGFVKPGELPDRKPLYR